MRPTVEDLFNKLVDYKGDPAKDLNKLTEGEVKLIISSLNDFLKDFKKMANNFEIDPEKQSVLLTVAEAAKYLNVTKQTIYNNIKDGTIKCLRKGRSIRIKKEELDKYFSFISGTVPIIAGALPMAICNKDFLYVDNKTREVLPFEEGKLYKIIYENLIWIYLFNSKWGDRARISKKEFRKYFAIAESWQIDVIKYTFNELG